MNNFQDNLDELFDRLRKLSIKQDQIAREIGKARLDIQNLKEFAKKKDVLNYEEKIETRHENLEEKESPVERSNLAENLEVNIDEQAIRQDNTKELKKEKSDIEKFIGENLISKIGILITIIGVVIGVKYSIDKNLISPLVRIIMAYSVGICLVGVALKLKNNYHNYSSVLLSGAMSILYFISFVAYDFYNLIPQLMAFLLMLVFTAFTVFAALKYNKQVIAHIGLIGAYAIPFLLSNNSGNVSVMFSYMSVINLGILLISFFRYWKGLFYMAFSFTWLIYFIWYVKDYTEFIHFNIAVLFSFVFFILFYLSFIAYKIKNKEKLNPVNILIILLNAFVYFAFNYAIIRQNHEEFLGLFTLFNAFVHFVLSLILYKRNLADKNLINLIAGLVLVFVCMAIPIQLDGNWVSLLWATLAILCFWIGRSKNEIYYERLSYVIMVLAFVSINHDWLTCYDTYRYDDQNTRILFLININFLSSLIYLSVFGGICYLNSKFKLSIERKSSLSNLFDYIIVFFVIYISYFTLANEISTYFYQWDIDTNQILKSISSDNKFSDFISFKWIWIINYSLAFGALISILNEIKLGSKKLGMFSFYFMIIFLVGFCYFGLFHLSELRDSYINREAVSIVSIGVYNIAIRYISYMFVALAVFYSHRSFKKYVKINDRIAYHIFINIIGFWIVNSELINIMELFDLHHADKLGLSIMWALYSLLLILIGLFKSKKYLRIMAIVLFAITLIKLFFYDISHMATIAKTIVFVTLGVILLLISFLYNKYKHLISNESNK
ncbi:MAG: DUF2339 domain-containing protein [Marinifilaceae bacterium]|jgi:uncharacterized membrane protein|nr:DUF2339 domain-containing protein [Marinifilaceae bacterium]